MRGRVSTTDRSSGITCRERCVGFSCYPSSGITYDCRALFGGMEAPQIAVDAQIYQSTDCKFIRVFNVILLNIEMGCPKI